MEVTCSHIAWLAPLHRLRSRSFRMLFQISKAIHNMVALSISGHLLSIL